MRGAVGAEHQAVVRCGTSPKKSNTRLIRPVQEFSPGWPSALFGLAERSVTTLLAYLMIGTGELAARASSTSNGFWGSMRCHLVPR